MTTVRSQNMVRSEERFAGDASRCERVGGGEAVRERKGIPLFRQVMIGAGVVLLGGLTLSFVHPWFIGLTWFASVMLIIAGTTGFCPMARILKRMPWNRDAVCLMDS